MPTLTISFTVSSPPPALGYKVRYWPTASPASVTEIFTSTSPVVIAPANEPEYSGEVIARCSNTQEGPPEEFYVYNKAAEAVGGGGNNYAPSP